MLQLWLVRRFVVVVRDLGSSSRSLRVYSEGNEQFRFMILPCLELSLSLKRVILDSFFGRGPSDPECGEWMDGGVVGNQLCD